jgi:hypothetical protein
LLLASLAGSHARLHQGSLASLAHLELPLGLVQLPNHAAYVGYEQGVKDSSDVQTQQGDPSFDLAPVRRNLARHICEGGGFEPYHYHLGECFEKAPVVL